ncbi:MAG: glycosyltransferase family 4 protein [Leptolyngbyaceae bacterium]|nr:glycosyltransferase family 4 protein [Leptolyngbyaceae bacterium]
MFTHHSSESQPIHVTMLGLGLDYMGGIASVENLIIDHCSGNTLISHLPTHKQGSKIYNIKVFFMALLKLIIRLSSAPVDIVHIHFAQRGSTWRSIILIWICKLFNKPMILHSHGSEFRLFFNSLNLRSKKIISTTFRQAEKFIVLSESWKAYYTETVGLKESSVITLMNPVKIPTNVPPRSDNPPITFIFLGRVGERKGAFDLIQAIAHLPSEIKEKCNVLIAGDGETDKATELVTHLGLTNCVQILGWINTQKRDELLAQSHAFILPSYNEGLPMSLLEAMGWELASIVTPVGGIPEVLKDQTNGLLVDPGDIDSIAKAIQTIVTEKEFREKLAQNARISVEDLDISNYQKKLRQAYEDAIKQHRKGMSES